MRARAGFRLFKLQALFCERVDLLDDVPTKRGNPELPLTRSNPTLTKEPTWKREPRKWAQLFYITLAYLPSREKVAYLGL